MRTVVLYNTLVRLEEGDLVAFDKERQKLWIRTGDELYTSSGLVESMESVSELHVNSVGTFSKHGEFIPKNLEWKAYNPTLAKANQISGIR